MRTLVVTCALTVGCGNGGGSTVDAPLGDTNSPGDALDGAVQLFDADEGMGVRVGGTALGIRSPVELTLAADTKQFTLVVSEDGTFRFPRRFPNVMYTVSESRADCEIVGGTGTLAGSDITSVQLFCTGIVELRDVGFTPGVIHFLPTFDPAIVTYAGTRPLFQDPGDALVLAPVAAYPTEVAVTKQPTNGLAGNGMFSVTVSHTPTTSFTRTYTVSTTAAFFREAYVKPSELIPMAGFASGILTSCIGGLANGNGVALSGDLLVVGAPCLTTRTGAAYVYRRTNTTWQFEQKLTASNAATGQQFGASVAIDSTTIVIGAPAEDTSGIDAGAAYVFVRSGTTWSQQSMLKAGNAAAGVHFGHSVGIAGDSVVVGAPDEGSNVSGAAYVFLRSGTTWAQQAYLKASNADAADTFGYAVAISGNGLVVGAINEDSNGSGATNNSELEAGAAYVFVRSGTAWSQQAYLKASNPQGSDHFGTSVSIDADYLVVGAPDEDGNDTNQPSSGAAYVFQRSGTVWTQDRYVKAPTVVSISHFGASVALDRLHLVVGALDENNQYGAAYAFTRTTSWNAGTRVQQLYPNPVDQFGSSVAVDGDTFAVGARGEDSNALNINGDQMNELAGQSGAVFVFR